MLLRLRLLRGAAPHCRVVLLAAAMVAVVLADSVASVADSVESEYADVVTVTVRPTGGGATMVPLDGRAILGVAPGTGAAGSAAQVVSVE